MADFLLNETTDDLAIVNGDLAFTTLNSQDVRQRVLITIRAWQGEWLLNESFGIPYLQEIFQKVETQTLVDDIFLTRILAVEGVEDLISFRSEFDRVRRTYTIVRMELRTTEGMLMVGREFIPDRYEYPDPDILQPIVCVLPN